LRPFCNVSPVIVSESAKLDILYRMFHGLGLRHVIVTDESQAVTGMITRKDLLGWCIELAARGTRMNWVGLNDPQVSNIAFRKTNT